jgi:hypothetical protein
MNEDRERTLTTADLAASGDRPSAEGTQAAMESDREAGSQPGRADATMAEGSATAESEATQLFPANEAEGFRSRWSSIQTSFVDEPRQSVEQADSLVAEVIKRLADTFASERGKLEEQWGRGDDINTEDLRVALRRYRSFFDRLLSV